MHARLFLRVCIDIIRVVSTDALVNCRISWLDVWPHVESRVAGSVHSMKMNL